MTARQPDLAPAIHPGEFVLEDVLSFAGMDVPTAAMTMGLDVGYLQALVEERAPVTPDAAVALGKFAGNGPDLWIALQSIYDQS